MSPVLVLTLQIFLLIVEYFVPYWSRPRSVYRLVVFSFRNLSFLKITNVHKNILIRENYKTIP